MNKRLFSLWCWRAGLMVLTLSILIMDLWAASHWKHATSAQSGTLAATFGDPDSAHRYPILAMDTASPLAAAGAKVGDLVKFDRKAVLAVRFVGTDETIGFTLFSGGRTSHLSVQPVPDKGILPHAATADVSIMSSIAVAFFTVIIAVLIGVRRGASPAMRLLTLALLCSSGIYIGTQPIGAVIDVYSQFIDPVVDASAYVLFTLFALIYPEDQPIWRFKRVRYAFYVYAACFAAVPAGAYLFALDIFPTLWTPAIWKVWGLYYVAVVCISVVFALGALAFSWRHSQGVMRQRLAWVGVCMGSMYAVYFLFVLDQKLGWPVPLYSAVFGADIVQLLALAGFGYALLRHRLFDFGFALNRALVVTIISSMLLVAFSLTEWGVDKLLHFEGREKNAVFDALVALGIILSFHRIQHWVNHRVDHTFFHHWYEAAEKLRHFLDKAAHVSQAPALQEKFMRAVLEFCGACGAAFYSLEASGNYELQISTLHAAPAVIDPNHDVAIDLMHTGQFVDLHDGGQSIPGELAFPMMVRGRLNGIFLLGERSSGDQYRPDQIALIGTAVHQYGLDLESLRVESMKRRVSASEQMTGSLQREVEALQLNNRDLRTTNEGLLAMVDGAQWGRVS